MCREGGEPVLHRARTAEVAAFLLDRDPDLITAGDYVCYRQWLPRRARMEVLIFSLSVSSGKLLCK